jgi:hypothetical protein
MHASLAVISWDPQIRGALIVLTGVVILMGSVYLLLATNVGARLGFLLAVAGLSGWLVLLNLLWLFGPLELGSIGYKGVAGGWAVEEIITGDLAQNSTLKAIAGTPGKPQTAFPNGWMVLPAGNSLRSSASPFADTALIPPATGAKATSSYPPPFTTTSDYVDIAAYAKGGHNYLFNLFGYKVFWRIRNHFIYIKHQPKYVIIRVQKALPSITLLGGATTLPAADVTQPIYTVVLAHNSGSLRLPPILIGFGSLLIFGLTCERLHARDKEIARRKAGGSGGPPGARSRPAGELQPA